MKINKHTLVHAADAGNGYHGYCQHCGLALVTDLGYCSWDDTVCIDREVTSLSDIPSKVFELARFKGLAWDYQNKLYVKPYSSETYTIDQLNTIIQQL